MCFEDQDVLIMNKPAGLAVHGGSGVDFGLIEYLRSWQQNPNLELVHRIDRYTSGCLLIVKQRKLLKQLQQIWHTDKVTKTYLALVIGKWPKGETLIDLPLITCRQDGEKHMKVGQQKPDQQGQDAQTLFTLKSYFPQKLNPSYPQDLSLVQAKLLTGRTHQIRVHCQHANHPVVGDNKYGWQDINQAIAKTGYKNMFLHAQQLKLIHPVSRQVISITAPLHQPEQELLDGL